MSDATKEVLEKLVRDDERATSLSEEHLKVTNADRGGAAANDVVPASRQNAAGTGPTTDVGGTADSPATVTLTLNVSGVWGTASKLSCRIEAQDPETQRWVPVGKFSPVTKASEETKSFSDIKGPIRAAWETQGEAVTFEFSVKRSESEDGE